MKIAVVTEDGTTISQHFGRAPYYAVIAIENGKVTGKEMRNKAGHHGMAGHHGGHETPGQPHGFDAAAQATHAGMMANIADCQFVIAGGMGWGAQVSLKNGGIETIVTDIESIDEAIKLYIAGRLPNLTERLH